VIVEALPDLLASAKWVNLGGGYLFDEARNLESLWRAVEILKYQYHCNVFFEPGAGLVRKTAFLVATVVDLFRSGGRDVAVLDSTVNHWPEVFEYQFEPDVVGHVEGGSYEYVLAGSSCLAGDLFGEYSFAAPLGVGSRIVFANAGAYSLVKAHYFNGINLPTMYTLTEGGELILKKRFTYEDFLTRCGGKPNVAT
jgi:carboxynorspermidine decarboxylase